MQHKIYTNTHTLTFINLTYVCLSNTSTYIHIIMIYMYIQIYISDSYHVNQLFDAARWWSGSLAPNVQIPAARRRLVVWFTASDPMVQSREHLRCSRTVGAKDATLRKYNKTLHIHIIILSYNSADFLISENLFSGRPFAQAFAKLFTSLMPPARLRHGNHFFFGWSEFRPRKHH